MFINNFSSSKLNTYQECQYKYRLKYHDRLEPSFNENQSTDALHYGSFVHEILEVGIEEDTLEGLRTLAEELRPKYQFDDKKLKNLESILKNFLSLNAKLPETVDIERKFKIEFKEGMHVNGYIDRIVKNDKGQYLVIDYKTSKRAKTRLELYKDNQMRMYAYAATQMYGVSIKDVVVAHYYPHYDKLISVKYSSADIAFFLNSVKENMWAVRKKKAESFQCMRNQFCDWCGYKDICPLFSNAIERRQKLKAHELLKESQDSKG